MSIQIIFIVKIVILSASGDYTREVSRDNVCVQNVPCLDVGHRTRNARKTYPLTAIADTVAHHLLSLPLSQACYFGEPELMQRDWIFKRVASLRDQCMRHW